MAALQAQIPWDEIQRLESLAKQLKIRFEDEEVFVNEQVATKAIRTPEVTKQIRYVANEPCLREQMVRQQRELVECGDS